MPDWAPILWREFFTEGCVTDYIGYEALTQAALRGVVREALRKIEQNNGMLGEHHFYLTFKTRAPGVKIADHLVEQFPHEMTIVIQHQFWDLEVDDVQLEVVLKFGGVPQHLLIPFAAVTRFYDPAVNFALAFENEARADADVLSPAGEPPIEATTVEPVQPEAEGTVVNIDAFRRK